MPEGVRTGVHSHHFLMPSVLQKLAPVLGSLGWIKPSLVEKGLSLGAGHSVQRNCLQGNKIFSQPCAGTLPPCPSPAKHSIEPPNTSTHKKLCMTDTGTAQEQPASKGSIQHSRERVLLAPSTSAVFPREAEGTWQSPCIPHSAQH